MTKDEALKMAQDACPYFAEQLKGAFYEGFITALDQLPDTTKMIDTGIDRGAWSDVPDATKWVDELRGDEDLDEPEPFGWLFKQADGNLYKLLRGEEAEWSENHNPHWIKVSPLYTAPPNPDLLTQTCCECGRSGGYALYCGECWGKATKREWVGLTDEEISEVLGSDIHSECSGELRFIRAIEAKLKEKNGY